MKYLSLSLFILVGHYAFAQKDSILIKEASFTYEVTEPVYETDSTRRLVRTSVPDNYRMEAVTETIQLKAASFRYEVTPPVYKKVKETITKDGTPITIEKEILVTEATFKKVEIPAEYGVLTKYVVCCLDGGAGTFVPSPTKLPDLYTTTVSQKLKTPAQIKKVEIPAEYYYF